jgi:hypothetical protein
VRGPSFGAGRHPETSKAVRLALIGSLATLSLAGLAAPAGAASIDFRHIAARVTIVPQARSDVQVVIVKTSARMPLKVYQGMAGETVVQNASWTSWFWNPGPSCDRIDGQLIPRIFGAGAVSFDDLPQIVVYTPLDAKVMATGALFGAVGRADSLELMSAGCGDWTVANIKNALVVDSAGWNEVRSGRAGKMTVRIGGAASIHSQGVADGLQINVAGSGSVKVAEASGPVSVNIAGGGDIDIRGGHATTLSTHIAGSGDIKYEGVADTLDAHIAGSGEIDVAKVTGQVSKSIAGSGSIDVGR